MVFDRELRSSGPRNSILLGGPLALLGGLLGANILLGGLLARKLFSKDGSTLYTAIRYKLGLY